MKYTKKLVSIPETEYNALIQLLNASSDPLRREKVETDSKILKTLKNPKYSHLERHVKYQSLNRKRQKLTKLAEDKPLKVIPAKKDREKETLLPTTGVVEKAENILQNIQQQEQVQGNEQREAEEAQQPQEPQEEQEEERREEVAPVRKPTLADFKGIIKNERNEELKNYVYDNKKKFGVTFEGGILKNASKALVEFANSDYKVVIDYLTGQRDEIPEGQANITMLFLKRLIKDPQIRAMVTQQEGHGRKKYLVDLKAVKYKNRPTMGKTPGLTRRKFQPKLWTKLPV